MQNTFNTYIRHAVLAALILVLEAWMGIGVIGLSVGIVGTLFAILRAIARKESRSYQLRVAAVYAALFLGTVGIIQSNWWLAERRAGTVIAAINRFHTDQGRYPDSLAELVPAYLSSTPRAGYTKMGSNFYYASSGPQLYFAVMFHGISGYDFRSHSWTTNE